MWIHQHTTHEPPTHDSPTDHVQWHLWPNSSGVSLCEYTNVQPTNHTPYTPSVTHLHAKEYAHVNTPTYNPRTTHLTLHPLLTYIPKSMHIWLCQYTNIQPTNRQPMTHLRTTYTNTCEQILQKYHCMNTPTYNSRTTQSTIHRFLTYIRKIARFSPEALVVPEVHCSMLYCVELYCSVLQCVAVCCSVLQCITVCCGVL